jgi:phosphoribosyl-AMP cyclohydrolase
MQCIPFGSTHYRSESTRKNRTRLREKGKVNGSLLKVEDTKVRPDGDNYGFLYRVNGDKGRSYLDIVVGFSLFDWGVLHSC